jgi:hypothetical protein
MEDRIYQATYQSPIEFRGINLDVNLFASAITLRPFQVTKTEAELKKQKEEKPKTDYELQVELKERIRTMLENEEKIPRELIFVGRAQRIVQSLNQVGSSIPDRWTHGGSDRSSFVDRGISFAKIEHFCTR